MGSCGTCRFDNRKGDEYPCNQCQYAYLSKYQPKTNADRIRGMTCDADLAVLIEKLANHTNQYIADWLSKPAGEGD